MRKGIGEKLADGIDNVISFFSPRAGFKRRMFRQAISISESFSSYKGASTSRLRSSWLPGGGKQTRTYCRN